MAIKLKGIDVSEYQKDIDWQSVKNDKVDFAILRIGYGWNEDNQKDKKFEQNYINSKAVGIPIGGYHYSYASTPQEAIYEAETCLRWIKNKQFEYPIFYDVEEGNIAKLGKERCTAIVKAFCERLEKEGYFVGVYANTNWFTNYLDTTELSKLYTIWKADYRILYDKKIVCDIHQYTSDGSVKGINGRVDMNTCTKDFSFIKTDGYNGFSKKVEQVIIKPATAQTIPKITSVVSRPVSVSTLKPSVKPAIISKPNAIYQVYAKNSWLPEVTNYNEVNSNGYAGIFGSPISGIRVRLSNGQTVHIQSHINGCKTNDWLGMVSKWDNTDNGYSGWKDKPMDCTAIKADGVKLKYRVHTLGGKWLGWVTTYNLADSVNGLAGTYGKLIDAIQIGIV